MSLFIDMICVLRDHVADAKVRHNIHLEIITLIEEGKFIESDKLKGVDPAYDSAYDEYVIKRST
jgi:hypothetical protein